MNMRLMVCLALGTFSIIYSNKTTQQSNVSVLPGKTPKQGIDIQKAMENPLTEVILRYQRDCGVSAETARLHEREFKRWLILTAENYPKNVEISLEVDNFWHTFLLFTREYEDYCNNVLGRFIHHIPAAHEYLYEKDAMANLKTVAQRLVTLYNAD